MAKKKDYVKKVGITGVGEDYSVYDMNAREKGLGFLIGFGLAFFAAQVMFNVIIASAILGVVAGFFAGPIFNAYLLKKRRNEITHQFRDMLDSLNNSFSAGKNTADAFADSYNDLAMSYGSDAIIVKEIGILVNGLYNNFTIEQLLGDMADRCDNDDIKSFAQTFSVCNRLGGNLKKIVADTRDVINDKIEIKMEIETIVSSNKNEINILCVMPFVIILMMNGMGNTALTANTLSNVVVKLIAVGMFGFAYWLGQKITDIKV